MSFLDDVAAMSSVVDDTFGEDYAYQPYAPALDTTAPETIDATRAAVTIRALFVEREARPLPHPWDGRQVRRPGVETGGPVLEISYDQQQQLAIAGTPLAIRVGDRLMRVPTGATYRVVSIEPVTPSGLMKLKVNQL